ncbi:MAG TPA: hypothetical protein P5539_10900 [Mesotoga sp.]|nr:hypothetical protein [Mesotoga sp.]
MKIFRHQNLHPSRSALKSSILVFVNDIDAREEYSVLLSKADFSELLEQLSNHASIISRRAFRYSRHEEIEALSVNSKTGVGFWWRKSADGGIHIRIATLEEAEAIDEFMHDAFIEIIGNDAVSVDLNSFDAVGIV